MCYEVPSLPDCELLTSHVLINKADVDKDVYDELETKLKEVFTNMNLDAHNHIRYSSILFIIT